MESPTSLVMSVTRIVNCESFSQSRASKVTQPKQSGRESCRLFIQWSPPPSFPLPTSSCSCHDVMCWSFPSCRSLSALCWAQLREWPVDSSLWHSEPPSSFRVIIDILISTIRANQRCRNPNQVSLPQLSRNVWNIPEICPVPACTSTLVGNFLTEHCYTWSLEERREWFIPPRQGERLQWDSVGDFCVILLSKIFCLHAVNIKCLFRVSFFLW